MSGNISFIASYVLILHGNCAGVAWRATQPTDKNLLALAMLKGKYILVLYHCTIYFPFNKKVYIGVIPLHEDLRAKILVHTVIKKSSSSLSNVKISLAFAQAFALYNSTIKRITRHTIAWVMGLSTTFP